MNLYNGQTLMNRSFFIWEGHGHFFAIIMSCFFFLLIVKVKFCPPTRISGQVVMEGKKSSWSMSRNLINIWLAMLLDMFVSEVMVMCRWDNSNLNDTQDVIGVKTLSALIQSPNKRTGVGPV